MSSRPVLDADLLESLFANDEMEEEEEEEELTIDLT